MAGQRDIEGRVVGGQTGVFGGLFFRRGKPIDVLALGPTESIYRNVHWDRVRRQWHVQGEGKRAPGQPRVRTHILYTDDEDTAGLAAQAWREQQTEGEVLDFDAARRRLVSGGGADREAA